MPCNQLDDPHFVTTWLGSSSHIWSEKESTEKQNQTQSVTGKKGSASPLLSKLSILFVNTAVYFNLTKQDALDTIGYILYEYDDLIHNQLLDCFIQHGFLSRIKDASYLTFSHQKRTISGVFLPLTTCYSSFCQPNKSTCYSPLCPNKRISSLLHIVNNYDDDENYDNDTGIEKIGRKTSKSQQEPKDWIECIPRHIRDSTNRKELKRQAGIAELTLTEQNYRKDLDILHNIYAIPLLESKDIISNPSRRQRFYNNVFANYLDIAHLHHLFYNKLRSHNRQSSFFVGRIGTIIMQHATSLVEPYIQYASTHIKAIYCMSIEHRNNPLFAQFLATQDAEKSTRRLGLRHYLTSPTLWIGKFKLMIEAILKNTTDDADQLALKASISILHDTLCRMNSSAIANSSPEDFRFEELSTSIYYHQTGSSEPQLLTLPDKSSLIREEAIWLARSTHPLQPSLCHIFLFSHALILTHPKVTNGRTEYIVMPGSPIPIQFLMLNNSKASSSVIRKLSFASTSMVSTPLHLINNLRRQKSINSEASSTTTESSESNNSKNSDKLARTRKHHHTSMTHSSMPEIAQNKTYSTLSSYHHVIDTQTDHRSRLMLSSQIKAKLSRFKSNFRLSNTVPVVPPPTTEKLISVTRRDSAPAMLLTNPQRSRTQCEMPRLSASRSITNASASRAATTTSSTRPQRRTLKVSHMAYPEHSFKLEFLTSSDRNIWETILHDIIMNTEKGNQVFKKKLVCKSLTYLPRLRETSISNSSTINTTCPTHTQVDYSISKIKCAYDFVYVEKKTGYHVQLVVFGASSGIWMGSRENSCKGFQLILPDQDVHKLSILGNKLIAMIHKDKENMLVAYGLKSMVKAFTLSDLPSRTLDWCMIKRSAVICFTTGKIRDQPVIIYLTRRLQTVWLVIVIPSYEENPTASKLSSKAHWFKKYRTEYRVSVKDPTEIYIIQDSIFVRSERHGIERIDIFKEPSAFLYSATHWIFRGQTTALIWMHCPLTGGIVCDSQHAYSVSLFDKLQATTTHGGRGSALLKFHFESQIKNVAMVYPYLVGFSSSIIEIRNIETTELVQVIKGSHIKLFSVHNDPTQPLYFTMSNAKDSRTTSMYQLQLSLYNNLKVSVI